MLVMLGGFAGSLRVVNKRCAPAASVAAQPLANLTHCPVTHHLIDRAVAVTDLAQNSARMLTHAGSGATNGRLVALEARGGFRLSHASNPRLIELSQDFSRHDLFIVDNLGAA